MSFPNFFIFFLLLVLGRSYIFSDEQKLRSILRNDNVTRALPRVNSSVPVQTRVQLNLHSVYNLDITKQKLSSSVLILNTWKDESLMWNITLYNGLSRLMFPSSMIWKPDIVLLNSMESKIIFHSDDEVLLDSKGIVTWSAYLNLVTYCRVNTTLYPFDRQTCDFVFSKQYLSDRYQYLCHNDSNNITESYVSNGEWDIRDIQRLNNTKYSLLGTFTDIIFRVVLERKTDYYYWTYVVPMISLAVVDVGTFCLPVKSHEKLNICLFVFLSMVYLITVVNDSMPHTSDDISKFGTLLWCFILLSGLIILTNILIITMVHRKCPKWLPTVVFVLEQCLISFCKLCVGLCIGSLTFIFSKMFQLIIRTLVKFNLNKENKKIIEKKDTHLQDEQEEGTPFISTGNEIQLQQTRQNTDPQDPGNESSKNTDGETDNLTSPDGNDNSGMPFPTKTKANPTEEGTSTEHVVLIHEDADDKTENETSPRFQLDTNDNSETSNINQSTDDSILVNKKSTEPNMHVEIKDDKNASHSTNLIDFSTKGADVEKDKNELHHTKQPEENNANREKDEPDIDNSENNVDIKDINEGQKDNIKDSAVAEDEDQSASHVLKPEDVQLIERSEENDDESLPNLSSFDKHHRTNLSNNPERENDIDNNMHDISITTGSNDRVKTKHSSIQSQHSSDGNSSTSQHNEEIGINQSFDNKQTTSSTKAKKSEPYELSEKAWHSTACFLDVVSCIAFILAFVLSYWAILGQLFAKNHNIM